MALPGCRSGTALLATLLLLAAATTAAFHNPIHTSLQSQQQHRTPLLRGDRHGRQVRTSATRAREETSASEAATAVLLGADPTIGSDAWEGKMDGFDWQLERARRALEGPAFSPFRMDFWRPVEDESEIGVVTLWDTMYILLMNVAQKFGWESVDGAPVAEVGSFKGSFFTFLQKVASGRLEDLAGGPLFLLLEKYFHKYGPVYKLAFGPRSFIVVSDPVMAKHLLKSNVGAYDKGVLASILEPIMGKGLIPADPQTWKVRRRAIVPGFHKRWLNRMMRLFAECNEALLDQVGHAADEGRTLDMEEKFCSVSLDIIGRAVFNYDFGSTNKESPVIKAVYRVLREAEHRSSSFIPYWKLPFATQLLASQVEFSADMRLLNDVLDELISKAVATQQVADVEELESRDLDVAEDPSLLRFLIDMRGEDTTSKQLRDDLMTMLIAWQRRLHQHVEPAPLAGAVGRAAGVQSRAFHAAALELRCHGLEWL
eukprot:TRINITY_DN869_c0_g3_i3.p2 TRINITY_DN869_c0_g3~~TRINITY_DN869_c0_g3_i3.p2  ORF type:complete len:485 (+),score=167.72 TRINITY_DN869_c0_g3_i3:323-1777(+)